jgi:bifunctional non-homologous end joining protein LigD
VAKAIKALLDELGVPSFVKTSGKTGLHVLTPWTRKGGFEEARAWAHELAEKVAEAMPDQATVEIRKAKRADRVYIDVLQNARGHHAVPPYVLRAVPGATISTPLDWKEVTNKLDPRSFTAKKVLAMKADPLAEFIESFGKKKAKR